MDITIYLNKEAANILNNQFQILDLLQFQFSAMQPKLIPEKCRLQSLIKLHLSSQTFCWCYGEIRQIWQIRQPSLSFKKLKCFVRKSNTSSTVNFISSMTISTAWISFLSLSFSFFTSDINFFGAFHSLLTLGLSLFLSFSQILVRKELFAPDSPSLNIAMITDKEICLNSRVKYFVTIRKLQKYIYEVKNSLPSSAETMQWLSLGIYRDVNKQYDVILIQRHYDAQSSVKFTDIY